jgi:hypothetical protein
MNCIAFKSGYKYQVAHEYTGEIEIRPRRTIETDWVRLTDSGLLTIKKGYASDGPSDPAVDTLNFMRGAFTHDALYGLMREGHLDHDRYREPTDRTLQRICLEDGMWSARAWWVYHAVRLGGGPSADPAHEKPIIWAPKGCPEGSTA